MIIKQAVITIDKLFDILQLFITVLQVLEWTLIKLIIQEQKNKFIESILQYYKDQKNYSKFRATEAKMFSVFMINILIYTLCRIIDFRDKFIFQVINSGFCVIVLVMLTYSYISLFREIKLENIQVNAPFVLYYIQMVVYCSLLTLEIVKLKEFVVYMTIRISLFYVSAMSFVFLKATVD